MIFVNFKTYVEGTGLKALTLVKVLEEVAERSGLKIIPVVQAADIKEASLATRLEIWSQKVDPAESGAHTGAILPEAVLEDGAAGTFLNHSEAKLTDFNQLSLAVKRCAELALKTLVFAGTIEELKAVCRLQPTLVAYEPPQFIGSSTTSVAKEQPEIISQAVGVAKAFSLPLVVGAGIKSAEDVRTSLALGAVGVAVASDIVKAANPQQELLDLTEGFK